MPLLKFRNYTAAARKPNMIPFGMYRREASADLSVIEGITAGGGRLSITGTQDGVNATFTLSATPQAGGLIWVRNGSVQSEVIELTEFSIGDYSRVGNVVTCVIPPAADDILLAISIGGQ